MRIISYIKDLMYERKWFNRAAINYNMLLAIIFLCVFGVIMIYSASYYYAQTAYGYESSYFLKNQAKFVAVGFVMMIALSFIDYHVWKELSGFAVFGAFALVLLLLVPGIGRASHGAVRWLRFGPIQFQAAEPIKLCMIMFLAYFIDKTKMDTMKKAVIALVISGLLSVLVWQISDNMSTAIVIMGICILLIFIANPKMNAKICIGVVIGFLVFLLIGVFVVDQIIPASENENFRITRIRAWLHPTDPLYASDEAMQPAQALYAIGAGGLFGKGLGQSLIKFRLPEPHNDYILAIIAEELGIFGVVLLMFLFVYLLYQIYRIAQNARDLFGKMIAAGVFAQIALQVVLNVAVVSSVIPSTGVTLPFISSGGASVIFLMAELGVVFSVDKWTKEQGYYREAKKYVEKQEKKRNKKYQGGYL